METGKKINHWCVLCGAGYHSCDLCSKTTAFTPWRTLTDTLEHFRIFMVLKDYNNQIIDREHAKELLSALDLRPQTAGGYLWRPPHRKEA